MSKPDLLMTVPMIPHATKQIEALFNVHKLWEAADKDALLSKVGQQIKAVANHSKVDAAMMAKMPNLKIVAGFGVGYDNVDAKYASQQGIIVTNTPNVLNEEVADTALGLLLMTVRELPQAERWLRAGHWTAKGDYPLTATTLRDRTVGIVGLGRIGQAIAQRVAAFGVPVVYHSRRPVAGVSYKHYPDLLGMARAVDTLIVITPGGAATANLINAAVLEALGPRGVLINVARGSVVDEPALIKALQDRTIQAAGLDVYAREPSVPQELLALPNVVALPHVASASVHTRNAMGQLVVDNLKAFLADQPPLTPVPETPFKGW